MNIKFSSLKNQRANYTRCKISFPKKLDIQSLSKFHASLLIAPITLAIMNTNTFRISKYTPVYFDTIKSHHKPPSSSIPLLWISQFLRNAEGRGGGYFIGLSVAFPLKRFRLPIPDFWRSQHYRKLSWSTCMPDRKQITAENAFSSRPRQRWWPIKLATTGKHRQQNERRLERKE